MSNLSRILVVLLLVGVVAAGLVAMAIAAIHWPVRRSQTSGSSQDSPPTRGKGTKTMSNLSRILVVLLLVGVVAAGLGVASNAIWTDSQAVDANVFSAGTVDISTSPTTALVTYSGMAPGDEVTNPITVTNAGSLELRYAVTNTTTEDTLAAQLDLTIKTGVTTCTNAGFDTDGSVIYGPADLGSIAGIDVIGDPTQGSQAGDRTLAGSGGNEDLCFNVELPSTTNDTFQGLTTTATFTFEAEQTSSNP
jgi:predicted ribosomally synthesized peptide with SipW-like signal peptide